MSKLEDIDRKQLTPIIVGYIRECALKMGKDTNMKLHIAHHEWGARLKGRWVWSSSEIEVGGNSYKISDKEVNDAFFLAVVEDALKESGVKGKISTVPSMGSGYYHQEERFDRLEIFAPPCKEFNRLNEVLKKHCCRPIPDTDVYHVGVCGKRSAWSDSGSFRYLCYNPANCQRITDLIEAVCDEHDKVRLSVEEFFDHGDDTDYRIAQYQESEWYGSRGQNMRLVIKGSEGKEKLNDVCTYGSCPPVPAEYSAASELKKVRTAAYGAVIERTNTPVSSFSIDQLKAVKAYISQRDTPGWKKSAISDLKSQVLDNPKIKAPKEWKDDVIKELSDLAKGKERQEHSLGFRL